MKEKLNFTFDYLLRHPDMLPDIPNRDEDLRRAVCDHIAGMTDFFALRLFKQLGI